MGTMLQKAGLETGRAPEMLNLTDPEQIVRVHQAYLEAGAQIVYANTFGANREKLAREGLETEQTVRAAEDLGYSVIMWSKDTIDWRDHDATLIFSRATEGIEGGDLVLMHPTEETAEALPSVLAFYKEKGLAQCTVSETLGL